MAQQTLIPGTECQERRESYWKWLDDVFNKTVSEIDSSDEACDIVTKAMVGMLPGLKQAYFRMQMPPKTAVTLILAKLGKSNG